MWVVPYLHGLRGFLSGEFYQVMGKDSDYILSDGHWSMDYPFAGAKELGERSGVGVRDGCFCAHMVVRELINVVERAVALHKSKDLDLEAFLVEIGRGRRRAARDVEGVGGRRPVAGAVAGLRPEPGVGRHRLARRPRRRQQGSRHRQPAQAHRGTPVQECRQRGPTLKERSPLGADAGALRIDALPWPPMRLGCLEFAYKHGQATH